MTIPFFSGELPEGIFATLLDMWKAVRSTYVSVLTWVTNTQIATYGTVWMVFFGSGLTAFLAYRIIKFLIR